MIKRLRAGFDTGSLSATAVFQRDHRRGATPAYFRLQSERLALGRLCSPRFPISAAATIAVLALSLSACQTPATRTQTVEVKVPVAVQPIKPAQVPAVPAPLGPRPDSLSAAADQLLAKHCEFVAYALLTDPLLRLSAGMPQQPLPQFPECEGK